ncbi:PHP domain-containing protein [Roseburia hominis]
MQQRHIWKFSERTGINPMNDHAYTPNYPVDLHCHTTRSDGADTPLMLIDHAAELGMKVIAITDHDVRPPETIMIDDTLEIIPVEQYARNKGVTVLRGIEISCETTAEDCHLVCFGCDWSDPFFTKLEQDVIRAKVESYHRLTAALTSAGMPLSWKEVLDNNGHPIDENQIQKKMIFELMARKGYAEDWSKAKLMVKNNPAFQSLRRKPDPLFVISEVHRCGGIAIMAHPYLVNDPIFLPEGRISRHDYIDRLIHWGLDGIEACYTYEKTSYDGTQSAKEIEREIKLQYADRLSIISGGSDYHADEKKGVQNPRRLGECGLTWDEFNHNLKLRSLLEHQADPRH